MSCSSATLLRRHFAPAALSIAVFCVAVALCTAAALCTADASEPWDDGCAVSGRVIDADGNPLPDVEVMALNTDTADAPAAAIRSWRCRTDEHGAFAFEGLPCGRVYLVFLRQGLTVEAEGILPFMHTAYLLRPGHRATGLEVRMLPADLVQGTVIDEAGAPVAGATVDCIWYTATTDADGIFEAPIEAADHASAWAPGYEASLSYSIQWRDGRPVFILRKGLDVSGRVLDAAGRPVAGVEIAYSDGGRVGPESAVRTTSGPDGEFVLHDVRRGVTPLYATHGGRIGTYTLRLIDDDADGVEIRLQDGATISGRLIDKATGKPLAGVPVSACSENRFAVQAKTDNEGRYALTGLPEEQIGVVPGRRVLRAWREPLARHFYLGSACTVPNVDFTIDNPYAPAAQPLTGAVVDEAGRPVAYATVLAFAADDQRPKPRPVWYGFSDATGSISPRRTSSERAGLTPGHTYTVIVVHDAHLAEQINDVVIPEDKTTKELAVVLKRGITAHGTINDAAGRPLAGAAISAAMADPPGPGDDEFLVQRKNDHVLRARSAPDGTYDLHGLTPGTWSISATHSDCAEDGQPAAVEIEAGVEPAVPALTLQRLKLGVLAGRIVDADGAPVPHTIVQAQTERPVSVYRWAYSDDDGRFQFDGIPEGTYRLTVTHMTRGNCFLNSGAATGTPDLVLKLVPARRVETPRWKLVNELGAPVTEFRFDVDRSEIGFVEAHTHTGEFTAWPQGNTLVIEADGYATKTITLDAPPENDETITITMVQGDGALAEHIMADGTRTVTKSSIVRRAAGPEIGGEAPLASEPHHWVCEGGPYGGTVRAVAIAASDPNVLYAAAPGGICKSVDAAASWQGVSPFKPGHAWSHPNDVEVDPRDADTVYAVDDSLFKSTDGGATWREVWPWAAQRELSAVEIDAGNPDTLYVWEEGRGICKSTDGGTTWKEANTGLYARTRATLCADRHWPGMLYVTTWNPSSLFESTDGGKTWRRLGGSIEGVTITSFGQTRERPPTYQLTLVHDGKEFTYQGMDAGRIWHSMEGGGDLQPANLTLDADDPDHLQISVASHSGRGDVYLSTDAGATWRGVESPFGDRRIAAMALSRSDKDLLFAADYQREFCFSADGGETWEYLYSVEQDPDGTETDTIDALRACRLYFQFTWSDHFARLAFHPTNPDVAYDVLSRRRGVVRTDDGGKTWMPLNNGIVASYIDCIACDPAAAGLVYAHGRSGAFKSTDRGRSWKEIKQPADRLAIFAAHPYDPKALLFAEHWQPLKLSRDGGETWTESNAIARCDVPISFLFDPDDAKHFSLLDRHGPHETTDGGRTWKEPPADVDLPRTGSDSAALSTQHSMKSIYLFDFRRAPWRSTDGGRTWSEALPPDVGQWCRFLYVHPADPDIVFVAARHGELLISHDGGDTWTAHKPSEPWTITCMTGDPTDPDIFYLGTGSSRNGILRTRDGGKTYDRLANDLGPEVQSIAVSPVDGTLYAGTAGYGVYRLVFDKDPDTEAHTQ